MNYADTYTKRYKVRYHAAGYNHTIQLRGLRDIDMGSFLSEASLLIGTLFNAYATNLADDFAFISGEYAEQDSSVFIPVAPPSGVTGLKAIALFLPIQQITSTTFSGKSNNGSKARISLFGVFWSLSTAGSAQDFLVTALEDAPTSAVISALNNALNIVAIDSLAATWYGRATIKPNDAWIRRARNGG